MPIFWVKLQLNHLEIFTKILSNIHTILSTSAPRNFTNKCPKWYMAMFEAVPIHFPQPSFWVKLEISSSPTRKLQRQTLHYEVRGSFYDVFSWGKKITSGCSNLGIILFIYPKFGNTNQSITWIRFVLVIFYGLYHGKSPSNHYVRNYFLLVPSIVCKSKMMICLFLGKLKVIFAVGNVIFAVVLSLILTKKTSPSKNLQITDLF